MTIGRKSILIIVLGILVIGGGIGAFIFYQQKTQSPLPKQIKDQISFIAYTPNPENWCLFEKESIKYDKDLAVLSYTCKGSDTTVTFSQQTLPDLMSETAGYEKFLQKMREYTGISTEMGRVSLTRPEELKGKQVAIANINGSLIFAKTDKDLSEDKWRLFFNNLVATK